MAVVSSMTRRMVVVLALLSMQMMSSSNASLAGTHVLLHDDETYEEVLDTSGNPILYGSANMFTVRNVDTGIGYLRFWFGLGYSGDVVRTDVELTMSGFGSTSKIYSCQSNGSMVAIPISSAGTPEGALIRVRHNATDGYYRLQITQETPAVFVQFVLLSQGGLLCTRGVDGSRLRFARTSSSSSGGPLLVNVDHADHSSMQIAPHVLRTQVSSS